MKKIIILALAVLAVAVMAGAGTFAYFSDTETSSANTFTSGTLDLALSGGTQNGDSVTGTWVSPTNWAPGEVVNATLKFTNRGSIASQHIYYMFSGLSHNGNGDDSNLMDKIIVTNMQERFNDVTTTNQAAVIAGQVGNKDSVLTLAEFAGFANGRYGYYTWDDQSDGTVLSPGNKNDYDFILGFQFDPEAGNAYQGDTCGFSMTANATQNSPTDNMVKLHQ